MFSMFRNHGTISAVGFAAAVALPATAYGNGLGDQLTTQHWCRDSLTLCRSGDITRSAAFSGFRVVTDVGVGGALIVRDIRAPSVLVLPNIGIETNLLYGGITAQFLVFGPGLITFPGDTQSFLRGTSNVVTAIAGVGLNVQLGGILSVGAGYLWYDPSAFQGARGVVGDIVLFASITPASVFRTYAAREAP